MKYIACKNIPNAMFGESQPWKFQPERDVPDYIRHDKKNRQDWIQNPETRWNYWTMVHGRNEADRVNNKANPPKFIHGFAADLDHSKAFDNALNFVEGLPFKPVWIEQSLGRGGCRLVFEFAEPMRADDYELAVIMMELVAGKLQLTNLPGYDPKSADPMMIWSNGNNWVKVEDGQPIPSATVFKWQKEALEQWSTKDMHGISIPLEDAYRLCKEKFGDKFNWPADTFQLEDQGPTWWVPESESPKSAIIKEHGIYTFSAHAPKPFYAWNDPDLLGNLVEEYKTINIEAAVKDVYFDMKLYYRRYATHGNRWMAETKEVLTRHLKKNCGLRSNVGKGERLSEVEDALHYIEQNQRVDYATPLLCYRPGVVEDFNSMRVLNVAQPNVMMPVEEKCEWGQGFPFIAEFLDSVWAVDNGDTEVQKLRFLMEFKRTYQHFLDFKVARNAALFLVGPKSVGKTFLTTALMGTILGGSNDPTQTLLEGNRFNEDMCGTPVWSLDDPASKGKNAQSFGQMLKKFSANPEVRSERKYAQGGKGAFNGVICVTLNDNAQSLELLPAVEDNSEDKWHFYKLKKPTVQFKTTENDNIELVKREAPFFLRWLLDWEVPAHMLERFPVNARHGYEAYHHTELYELAQQGSLKMIYGDAIRYAFRTELMNLPKEPEELALKTQAIMRNMNLYLHGSSIKINPLLVDRFLADFAKDGWDVRPIRQKQFGLKWVMKTSFIKIKEDGVTND